MIYVTGKKNEGITPQCGYDLQAYVYDEGFWFNSPAQSRSVNHFFERERQREKRSFFQRENANCFQIGFLINKLLYYVYLYIIIYI